jgi:N-acetylneuraminic acid mutarotase
VKRSKDRSACSTSTGDLNMKMFRPALAGALSAFVLLVCIQLNARAKVAAPSQSRQLFFEDRVAYQRAIEEVYWRHRIWPNNRPDRKPSLDAVMSQATIEQKVQDYLRRSELLQQEWQKPITPDQLQAEMDRMAQHTKQPEVLRELFAALGNDPFVIAECLARPVLAERFANGDPVAAAAPNAFGAAHPTRMPPQKSVLVAWLAKAETQVPMKVAAIDSIAKAVQVNRRYHLPAIASPSGECIDDSWTATSTTGAPARRYYHTAVWTGSEMIVWGGIGVFETNLNTGRRYNPATDSWTRTTTTNAPDGRFSHTAVWTGSEMIVWGGFNGFYVNTGGRYNPGTDSWTATTLTNAPTGRGFHRAVLTSSEMIVWGGYDGSTNLNTGGRYNLGTNSWTATSTTNAPTARFDHTAVWTGSEMIVWGGFDGTYLNTGGRYNPGTDSWTATSTTNAPTGRERPRAVWTGSEMIAWGGFNGSYVNTGGRYNPGTDSWTATTTTNAPTGRTVHTAVWTGSEMIVWGGYDGTVYLKTGGRYNPGTDSWTATSTTNAPTVRGFHTAVWTSSEMIVWGGLNNMPPDPTGRLDTGGRYCAAASGPITLGARGRKEGGINTVRLTWDGATSPDVDLYRNGVVIVTTANDGLYIDSTGDTGRARYTYQVCEAGTQTCSNEATVTFPQ